MTDPTPPPAHLFDYTAKLVSHRPHADHRPDPTSWFVTFGFGKPAENTYTEVRLDPGAVDPLQTHLDAHAIERVLDDLVRSVAVALYGQAWAFHYRPAEYATAIERYSIRLREVVEVSSIEVYL